MPIKVVVDPDRPYSINVVNQMVGNFLAHTKRTDPFDLSPHQTAKKLELTKDGYSIWFSKGEIDALFQDNASGNPDGLRIYFAMHGNSPEEMDVYTNHPTYKGQFTTILVCTQQDGQLHKDLLTTDHFVSVPGYQGMGLDEGTPVPPPPQGESGSLVVPNIPK
jgi:hypothetical protein